MKERLTAFIDELRQAGLRPSIAEGLDAVGAVTAGGVERAMLREALATTLVKDHAERATFDEVFDRFFALPAPRRGKRFEQKQEQGEGRGRGGSGDGAGRRTEREATGSKGDEKREQQPLGTERESADRARELARQRALLALPFRDMDPRQVEELEELVEDLARRFRRRCARRYRRAKRGRLDIRRTIRRALSRGGVPIELELRKPRPRKTDLVALVDLSYSTATAAIFMLALLAPARSFFRRVRLFGYVDAPAEISFEHGRVLPHEPIDLNARSDFGNVLRLLEERHQLALGRNTVLLILGDARNNRRPPRADVLARLGRAVRAVLWLNPEPQVRWDTGDSVMSTYARHAGAVLAAHDTRSLLIALGRVAKTSF